MALLLQEGVEERTIELENQQISYLLKRSPRRRTIVLHIDGKGLTMSVPLRTGQQRLETVLRDKAGWVLKKLHEQRSQRLPPRTWEDGETLPFLGTEVRLILGTGSRRIQLSPDGDSLEVMLKDPDDKAQLQSRVVKWYRQAALAHFTCRVAHYAAKLDVAMPPLRLSNATGRWGSCNSRGEIRLSWRLIKAPHSVIDYVVAHELAHLKHLNHSPAFWETVAELYPNHVAARAILKTQGHRYHTF